MFISTVPFKYVVVECHKNGYPSGYLVCGVKPALKGLHLSTSFCFRHSCCETFKLHYCPHHGLHFIHLLTELPDMETNPKISGYIYKIQVARGHYQLSLIPCEMQIHQEHFFLLSTHFACRTISDTYIDFEMKAETDGYIALGFAHGLKSNRTKLIYDGLVAGVSDDGDGYLGSYSFDLTDGSDEKLTKIDQTRYKVRNGH